MTRENFNYKAVAVAIASFLGFWLLMRGTDFELSASQQLLALAGGLVLFLAAIIYGGLAYMKARSTDTMVLAPLCIALTNFFVIKAIFSQQENHPAVFLMLGAVTALVLKVRKEQEELGMVPQPLRNAAR